jgi:tRNA pseudouridine38-40 synthase
MRYFLELAYNGTRFCGWQRQPNAPSVQERIETTFSLILRQPTEILGCGRTDTGVHASYYVAHFDFDKDFPDNFLDRANKMLGNDIVLKNIKPVAPEAHARFDASLRSYEYHITAIKNPFATETEWYFMMYNKLDIPKMQEAADLLSHRDSYGKGYKNFAPFCKTHSDTKTMQCDITHAEWIFTETKAVFHISANRFLRGMVRLIVGACINIGLGQMTLTDLKQALDEQTPLKKSSSVPPTGLFLTEVKYPY